MRNLKRTVAILLSLMLTLAMSATALAAETETGFSDVAADAWYADAVAYVQDNGIMSGTSNTTFAPNATMTRAMLATVLYRAAGSPAVGGGSTFTDVAANAYYRDAAAWAGANGIVSGYGNGLFGSNDPVTREQIATILWRYADSPAAGAGTDFADEGAISSYAAQAVDWARSSGIIGGLSDGRFDPKGNATRAEVATILRNYMTRTAQPVLPDEPTADGSRILVAYFSRAGENYNVGVVERGNTSIVAEMTAEQTGGDLFEIRPVQPYPTDYAEMLAVARQEASEDARPEIADTVENMADYDVIFLGYPIWSGDMPKIVYHFLESYDFSGKTIVPFCTHEGSGLSGTAQRIAGVCSGADILDGLAIRGQTAQNAPAEAEQAVAAWVRESGVLSGHDVTAPADTTDISITVGDVAISATLYDNETTRDFLAQLPLTLNMGRYFDREYAARLPEPLSRSGEEIDDFSNGDICFYPAGGSLAIYFDNEDSSSQSGLIRMGRITSGLDALQTMEGPATMRIEVLP